MTSFGGTNLKPLLKRTRVYGGTANGHTNRGTLSMGSFLVDALTVRVTCKVSRTKQKSVATLDQARSPCRKLAGEMNRISKSSLQGRIDDSSVEYPQNPSQMPRDERLTTERRKRERLDVMSYMQHA